jgi:hypothetical protein
MIAIALILYEIQWVLPPFVLAGVLAYCLDAGHRMVERPKRAAALVRRLGDLCHVSDAWLSHRLFRNSAVRARDDPSFQRFRKHHPRLLPSA